jgi:hypothetical protein
VTFFLLFVVKVMLQMMDKTFDNFNVVVFTRSMFNLEYNCILPR